MANKRIISYDSGTTNGHRTAESVLQLLVITSTASLGLFVAQQVTGIGTEDSLIGSYLFGWLISGIAGTAGFIAFMRRKQETWRFWFWTIVAVAEGFGCLCLMLYAVIAAQGYR
jgi:hypothetical protein